MSLIGVPRSFAAACHGQPCPAHARLHPPPPLELPPSHLNGHTRLSALPPSMRKPEGKKFQHLSAQRAAAQFSLSYSAPRGRQRAEMRCAKRQAGYRGACAACRIALEFIFESFLRAATLPSSPTIATETTLPLPIRLRGTEVGHKLKPYAFACCSAVGGGVLREKQRGG